MSNNPLERYVKYARYTEIVVGKRGEGEKEKIRTIVTLSTWKSSALTLECASCVLLTYTFQKAAKT
jgi:hypothetical protein